MNYIPYFYVIEDTRNGKLYGGCKYGKNANPQLFMKEGGYTTSSYIINHIINECGISVFKIRKIVILKTEEETKTFETRFLSKINAQINQRWYNGNNGYAPPSYGNTFWCNDGKQNKRIDTNEQIPDGFVIGRLKYSYPKNRKKKSKEDCMKNNKNRGKVCYTNGENNIYLFEGEDIPEGFSKGTKTSNSNTLLKQKRSWYTNGTENISLKEGEKVPFGYYKGKVQGKR